MYAEEMQDRGFPQSGQKRKRGAMLSFLRAAALTYLFLAEEMMGSSMNVAMELRKVRQPYQLTSM
jgi:hypothetical protein